MANRFNEKAATFDSERQLALADKFSKAIAERLGDKHLNHFLDFGGGTGNLAIALVNHFEQGIIANISQPMLDQAQKKISESS
ncbi:class I SAM-dependent methyltransferase [Streptococcus hongkongensis]